MSLPFEPVVFGIPLNVHLILEYLAFFIAFRYYVYLRKKNADLISTSNRLSIIIGAVFGALILSRGVAFLENPVLHSEQGWYALWNNKTIMGGLFGGLLGVELSKKIIGEHRSSGDLFTLPIIMGIGIGRIGCFLSGTTEFTYGVVTDSGLGMDLGDGLARHPIALYELVFLLFLFGYMQWLWKKRRLLKNGDLFKLFMLSYFSFRFFIEFLKANVFYVFGLSSIQLLCLICLMYYHRFIVRICTNTLPRDKPTRH